MPNVESLTRTKIPLVQPEDTINRIAQFITRTRCNAALVRDGNTFVGNVMRSQLLRPPLSPETKAGRLISHPPVLEKSESIKDAIARTVQSRCDILPVIDKDEFQGAVLARDLAFQDRSIRGISVEEISDQIVPPISSDVSISEAGTALRQNDLESIPLVEGSGDLVGWISFSSIHRYMISPEKGVRGTGEFVGEKDHPLRNPAKTLAKEDGSRIEVGTGVHDVVAMMCSSKLNEITIVEDEEILGQLNIHSILTATREESKIPVQVKGLEGEDPMVADKVISDLRAMAGKISSRWQNVETPKLTVKSYHHQGSKRKRYEVKVSFPVPDQHVAQAEGWDLLTVCQTALKRIERELRKERSKIIDSHHGKI